MVAGEIAFTWTAPYRDLHINLDNVRLNLKNTKGVIPTLARSTLINLLPFLTHFLPQNITRLGLVWEGGGGGGGYP